MPNPSELGSPIATALLLETAKDAAAAAAGVHRARMSDGSTPLVDAKSTFSDFVSDVDLQAQAAALRVIRERHPDHAVMAEEEGGGQEGGLANEHTWIVDPLDGTTNFLHGHPYHAASVAVWDDAGPVAAAVHAQALDRVWTAARGQGAFENGAPIRVSDTMELTRFLLGTGFPFKSREVLEPYLDQLGRALGGTSGVRRTGAAAIDLAYVACGILDGFWEEFLNPWDFAAGLLLITEAGGAAERLRGGAIEPTPGTVLAANSPHALANLRQLLLVG